MKKRLFAAVAIVLFTAVCFSGCALYGNDRSHTNLMEVVEDGSQIVFRLSDESLRYDPATRTISKEDTEWTEGPETVLKGDTFPRGVLETKEGYEELSEQVKALAKNPDDPLIHALAWEQDGCVYGFCNVYSKTTGFLSGGGQCDTKHIVRAVLFTYEDETLTVKEELEKCVVVAYDGNHAIYFHNREYFSKTANGEPNKICKDEAFDTGMTSYGYARFCFGGGYCILFFNHDKGNAKKQYHLYILATMAGEKLAELRIVNPYQL